MNKDNSVLHRNQVTITGIIDRDPVYSHTVMGEDFYQIEVWCPRMSGCYDIIPVTVSGDILEDKSGIEGKTVCVKGSFRSRSQHDGEKRKMILYVMAGEIIFMRGSCTNLRENNKIFLCGYVCKTPVCRKTPLGRDISDLLLKVRRSHGRMDYIPCIAWGRNAIYAEGLSIGTVVTVHGRIQSRDYTKRLEDGTEEERTAFEVSVSSIRQEEECGSVEETE